MDIKPHSEIPKKALVTPEDIQEAVLLQSAIPTYRAHLDFYGPYHNIQEATLNMAAGRQVEPITFSHRQLRWIGERVAPWGKDVASMHGREEIDKRHKMATTILEYLGLRLGKGG